MASSLTYGQEKTRSLIDFHFTNGRVPHAQCFIDKEGRGGLALALDTAFHLLYENGETPNLYDLLRHPDLHFLFPIATTAAVKSKPTCDDFLAEWKTFVTDHLYGNMTDWLEIMGAENKQGNIPVSEINRFIPKMHLKPYAGKNKVCVLWGGERLRPEGANKLLKLIEEPPKDTFFLLVSNDLSMLLPTIRSRCQIVKLPPLSLSAVEGVMIDKGQSQEEAKMNAILSEGNLRIALQRCSDEKYLSELEGLFVDCLRLAFQVKIKKEVGFALMEWTNTAASLGRVKQKAFFLFGLSIIRQAMLLSYQTNALVHFQPSIPFSFEKFAQYIHGGNALALATLCEKAVNDVERNANPKILFANFCLELTRLLHRKEST